MQLSNLLKEIISNKKYMYNINSFSSDELKSLFNMCSTDAFNMFIIKSDGSIWVHTNIIDPRYIVYDDDGIVSYSNIFIMNDSIMGVSTGDENIEKILNIIKDAFVKKEKGFLLRQIKD